MQRKQESREREGCVWSGKGTAAGCSGTRLCVRAWHGPVSNVADSCRVEQVILESRQDSLVDVEINCPWRRRTKLRWARKKVAHHHQVIDEASTSLRQFGKNSEKDGDGGKH